MLLNILFIHGTRELPDAVSIDGDVNSTPVTYKMETLINQISFFVILPSTVFTITIYIFDFYQVSIFIRFLTFFKSKYNVSTFMKIFLRLQVPIYFPGVHTPCVAFRFVLQIGSLPSKVHTLKGSKHQIYIEHQNLHL